MVNNDLLKLQAEVTEKVKKLRDLDFLVKVNYSGELKKEKLSITIEFIAITHEIRGQILEAKEEGNKLKVQKLQQLLESRPK